MPATCLLTDDNISRTGTQESSDSTYAYPFRPSILTNNENTTIPTGMGEQRAPENAIYFIDRKGRQNQKERELQWWVGRVSEIHHDSFTAILEDLDGRTNIVEFENDVISPVEKDLLFVGSKLTYSVSVIDKACGTRVYNTKFAFSSRRKWIDEYETKAKEIADRIFPESLLNL